MYQFDAQNAKIPKISVHNCPICEKSVATRRGSRYAYCEECLKLGREKWDDLIGILFASGIERSNAMDWELIIKNTCAFYNRTEDELWDEVAHFDPDI